MSIASARAYRTRNRQRLALERQTPESRAQAAERQRAYYVRHRERVVAAHDRPEARELASARQRAYYARNRDRVTAAPSTKASRFAHGANRRAKKYGLDGLLTAAQVRPIDGPCVYCGTTEGVGWDHVNPLVVGGANSPENLAPCCLPCNRRKQRRTPEQAGMAMAMA